VALLTPDFADAQFRFGRGRGSNWGGSNWGGSNWGGSGWGVGFSDGNFGIGYSSGNYGRGYGWGDGYGYGRGWGYGGYPYYGGSGFSVGLGSGYYGGSYYGGGYPSYGGYSYDYPSYGGTVYSTPSYGYSSSPSYMGGSYDMSGGSIYQAGYGSSMNMANVVRLEIIVPDDNAELMIQGQRVGGTGRHRSFVSPPLEPNKEYTYEISIRGSQMRGGEDTRKIDVKAGNQYTVDFTRSNNERLPAPSGIETDRRDRDRDMNRDRDNRDNRDRDNRDNRDRDNRNNPRSDVPGSGTTPPKTPGSGDPVPPR